MFVPINANKQRVVTEGARHMLRIFPTDAWHRGCRLQDGPTIDATLVWLAGQGYPEDLHQKIIKKYVRLYSERPPTHLAGKRPRATGAYAGQW